MPPPSKDTVVALLTGTLGPPLDDIARHPEAANFTRMGVTTIVAGNCGSSAVDLGKAFDEIYDVIGVRIIVDTVQDCYSVLGIVHGRWHPVPGEIDDYIATPKESMYQSLHTAVIGPKGQPVEIQIRTREMHQVAEYGIAAHWRYKEGGGKSDQKLEAKITWLRQLMDWRDEVADAEEFVESLKSDVFQDMVYVFTPAGDIIELPNGANLLPGNDDPHDDRHGDRRGGVHDVELVLLVDRETRVLRAEQGDGAQNS